MTRCNDSSYPNKYKKKSSSLHLKKILQMYLCQILVSSYILDNVFPLSSSSPTCVQRILLWAPGERSEAQEEGEVSLRLRDNRRLLLRGGAGIAAPAGWKNSAGRQKRGEMPLVHNFSFVSFLAAAAGNTTSRKEYTLSNSIGVYVCVFFLLLY